MQPIAIAVIHGAGIQKEDFAEILIENLQKKLEKWMKDQGRRYTGHEFIFQPIYWGEVFNQREKDLWVAVQKSSRLDFSILRKFVIEFLGDAIAYQPTSDQFQNYEQVHEIYFKALTKLSEKAGANAPLIVIGHSLGTVITSNLFYDLQKTSDRMTYIEEWTENATPLEKGETLARFISLGSPLALWSLRYTDFDRPIQVPSRSFCEHYPDGRGGWWNIYDRDDILAYPLKTISDAYGMVIQEDREVNTGNLLTSWNPASHFQYVKDKQILNLLTEQLTELFKSVNNNDTNIAPKE
ncbi:chemotaxis protein [Pseudalkalibacillus sp. R45]|uniref:chemotaxis protein n=1 Tax=Pseudalkalibacillus sp. R45 TaxID=3457433 RepID=UPI003FCCF27F